VGSSGSADGRSLCPIAVAGPVDEGGDVTDEGLSDAKQVLLRALESIGEIEDEMGAEVRHVAVVYSVYRKDDDGTINEQGGWNHSDDPDWLIAAMLRKGADSVEDSTVGSDDAGE
jgi:hypothetical protein